ncbi:hypothetical protein SAMN05216241_107134 [Limimonas halophila]|uniref:Uncharacterized protein n=1 Tax=Limimonas halophila TaxID=1082479 RepID=A0A1G7SSV3_9PROT|nr:hypothetical protein SAMN05216241_107134 [Limimonas halophila]
MEIVATYVYQGWPENKGWCARCEGHRHQRGFIASLSDGSAVMLGRNCGQAVFGTSWDHLEAAFKATRSRQDRLLELDRMAPIIDRLLERLKAWRHPAQKLTASHRRFRAEIPILQQKLSDAVAQAGGVLTVHVRERDAAEEARRAERGTGGDEPVYRWVEKSVHRIAGQGYFAARDPQALVAESEKALKEVRAAQGDTDARSLASLKQLKRHIETAVENLQTVAAVHSGAGAFFEPRNLRAIAEWANEARGAGQRDLHGHFDADGEELYLETPDGQVCSMGPPPDLGSLDPEVLDLAAQLRPSASD